MSGSQGLVAEMSYPGRCRWCGEIYDGGPVTIVARYADCSVWKAPCCGNTADDRPQSWGGSFFPLSPAERKRAEASDPRRDVWFTTT